jgi:AcrR family transcriptional regulator
MVGQQDVTNAGDARARLLEAVVDEIARGGLGDRSLRDIAAALGTSHRMLLYHFGSRSGLVAAVVDEVERRQRLLMAADGPSSDTARSTWRRVSDPAILPFVRLFFELAGQAAALPGREDVDMTQPWIDDALRMAAVGGVTVDAADVRLGIAVVRGLLLDVVLGGDRAAADRAFERYLALAVPRTA